MAATTVDLKEALAACAAGDRAALRAIYERECAAMIGVAARIVKRRELAEEVVQEAFVRIWRNAHRYNPELGPPRPGSMRSCATRRSTSSEAAGARISSTRCPRMSLGRRGPCGRRTAPRGAGAAPLPRRPGGAPPHQPADGLCGRLLPWRDRGAPRAAARHGQGLDPPLAGPAAGVHGMTDDLLADAGDMSPA